VNKRVSEVVGITPALKVDGGNPPETLRRRGYDEVFTLYGPAPEERPDSLVVVVRPRATTAGLTDRLKQAALAVGPRVLVEKIRFGSEWLDDTVLTPKRRTVLLSLLGGLGLLLTLIGVFGMTAYAVARRTQEIGVRMAFGATARDVIRAMISDAAWPVAIGVIVGLVGSWFATRLIATFLFETTPTDAATFAAAAIALCVAALIAVWIPAKRATHVNPVTSLRAE